MYQNKISELKTILKPPAKPLDCDEEMLARNETVLRIKFPNDFLEFGRIYGSGQIKTAYTWEVWSPFRPTYPLFVMEFARTWNMYRDSLRISNMPFGIFPEVGGIMPFSNTPNGDWVCWITDGDPDGWPVVDLGTYEKDGYQKCDVGFSEYFVSVLTRKIILERHEGGETWNPQADITFEQGQFAEQNY